MNADKFLAAMAQDLTINQLEGCGIVDYIKTGIYFDDISRKLSDNLSKIIGNLNIIIDNADEVVQDTTFGICFNYSKIFTDKVKKNYDFYSLNHYLTNATGCYSGYPIPSCSGGLWKGDNLKYRIIYMQWVIRQLNTLKNYLGVE